MEVADGKISRAKSSSACSSACATAIFKTTSRVRSLPRMHAVHCLGPQHFHRDGAIVREGVLGEQPPCTLENRGGDVPRLLGGILTDDHQGRRTAIAVRVGEARLVVRGRGQSPGTAHAHTVGPQLFELHGREVADHIREQVPGRIVHLVGDLLGHGGHAHPSPGPDGLGHDERAVGGTLDDRVAHVVPLGGHRAPVGGDAAGGLRTALDDVARQAPERQPIQLARAPAEGVNQGRERERTVRTAARDDDLRALLQRLRDRKGSEVGVRARHLRGQRSAAFQVSDA